MVIVVSSSSAREEGVLSPAEALIPREVLGHFRGCLHGLAGLHRSRRCGLGSSGRLGVALLALASRILAAERERQNNELSADRKAQVGSGDRSERIRTYNFPQGRCTDHRINLTLYSLDRIMEGEVEPLFEALATAAQTEALKAEAEA